MTHRPIQHPSSVPHQQKLMVEHPQHGKLLEGVHVLHQPTPPENNDNPKSRRPLPMPIEIEQRRAAGGVLHVRNPPGPTRTLCATTILYIPTHHPHPHKRFVRVGGEKRHTKPVTVDSERRPPNLKFNQLLGKRVVES